jgi:hypothetical protein
MSFAQRVIDFHHGLAPDWEVPEGIEIMFPYEEEDTMQALKAFYKKYYDDNFLRIGIFGINPGRFGAGVTGVPFTDPIRLEEEVGISNDFKKRQELSSVFVYEIIKAWGGVEKFFQTFYITSLSPLGFTKNGRNYNYYDDKLIQEAVKPHIIDNLQAQLSIGISDRVALCMGRGKNSTFFEKLNEEKGFFGQIVPLPHPRWVMQYRRVRLQEYVDLYLEKMKEAVRMVT